jgi:quinol monooxygenase YgiN
MIIVSGILKFDPSDRDAAVGHIIKVAEATRAEDGNLSYGMYEDPQDPGAFKIYEEWDNPDVLGSHMGTEHMAEFMGAIGGLKILESSITSHEVASSNKLM